MTQPERLRVFWWSVPGEACREVVEIEARNMVEACALLRERFPLLDFDADVELVKHDGGLGR